MKGKILLSMCALSAASLVTGCGFAGDADDGQPEATASSGMALSVDVDVETDVAKFRYVITRVSCGGEDVEPFMHTAVEDLSPYTIPGGIDTFEDSPYDADSEHQFADHYVVLEAGCYDVLVEPLTETEDPSEDCLTAMRHGVVVNDGLTTEILLISQCDGAETGGLDTIASLNRPPHIKALTYNPSKFVGMCVETQICATAVDPDNDPVEFEWNTDGLDYIVSFNERNDGSTTECIQVTPEEAGSYDLDVTVYDHGYDSYGSVLRIEDITGEDSHDNLQMPLYVTDDDSACPEEPECVEYTCEDLKATASSITGGTATLIVPEDACPMQVSVSSYMLPSGDIRPFEEQILYDNLTALYGPGTHTITVEVPACAWQTDIYCGEVALMQGGDFQGDRLIDADVNMQLPACGYPN